MRRAMLAMVAVLTAAALGFLEAAWTGPGRGGPTNTWMGVVAILAILAAVSWPRLWWVPGLAILEEGVHLFVGYGGLPGGAQLFGHWSLGLIGFNLYPWLVFPLVTVVGEILAWTVIRRRRRSVAIGPSQFRQPGMNLH